MLTTPLFEVFPTLTSSTFEFFCGFSTNNQYEPNFGLTMREERILMFN